MGGSFGQICMKLREEDMDACQIEISEMDVAVGNGLQPRTEIGRLRITRDEKKAVRAYRIVEECLLPTNHAKVFHVFDANDYDVRRDGERLPIGHEKETTFRGIDNQFLSVQDTRYRFVSIDRKTWAGTDGQKFGIASCCGLRSS